MAALREFVVFDTETTGSPPGARIVEIGALRVRGRNVVERFEALIFPEGPIPPAVTEVHGITDADVAEAPTAEEVVPDFLQWTQGLPLLAHNASFDAAMLAGECARLQIRVPDNPVLCTLRASRSLLRRRSHALESLVRELGLPNAPHHRATSDAQHALHLLWWLQDSAGGELPAHLLGRGRTLSTFLPDPPSLPDSRRFLADAAVNREPLELHYLLPSQRILTTLVTPRYLYKRRLTVMLEALCHQALHYKSYRLDRVIAAHPNPDAPPAEVRRARDGAWR